MFFVVVVVDVLCCICKRKQLGQNIFTITRKRITTLWSINYGWWIKFRWLGLRISGSFPWQASGEIEEILCLFYFSISVTNGELLTALWHRWGDWERRTRRSRPRECFKSPSVSSCRWYLVFKSPQLLSHNFNSGSVEIENFAPAGTAFDIQMRCGGCDQWVTAWSQGLKAHEEEKR